MIISFFIESVYICFIALPSFVAFWRVLSMFCNSELVSDIRSEYFLVCHITSEASASKF